MYNVWKFVLVEMQQYPTAAYLALMSSFITKKICLFPTCHQSYTS